MYLLIAATWSGGASGSCRLRSGLYFTRPGGSGTVSGFADWYTIGLSVKFGPCTVTCTVYWNEFRLTYLSEKISQSALFWFVFVIVMLSFRDPNVVFTTIVTFAGNGRHRSEERRVGKECR